NDPYEGLSGVTVPAGKFAVFEHNGKGAEGFIEATWEKIYSSDLDVNNGYNLEVYTLDSAYEVQKAEIRVSIR
ncbi:MAG: effector binding domain-containing protein, partial [Bacteroidota bacterium]